MPLCAATLAKRVLKSVASGPSSRRGAHAYMTYAEHRRCGIGSRSSFAGSLSSVGRAPVLQTGGRWIET